MMYKGMIKNISKANSYFDSADMNIRNYQTYYTEYFLRMITNRFDWTGFPMSIDTQFIEDKLATRGYVGVYFDDEKGLIVSSGVVNGQDLYGNPINFRPLTPNMLEINSRKRKVVSYSDMADKDGVVLIKNNNFSSPSTDWLNMYTKKMADIEQSIEINRKQLMTPYFFVANDDNINLLKTVYAEIEKGVPVIYLPEQKSNTGTYPQIQDRIQKMDVTSPYIIDKLNDELTRLEHQVLTISGIDSLAVNKKERLVTSEADSNKEKTLSNLNVELQSRRKAIPLIIECFKSVVPDIDKLQVNPYRFEGFDIETPSTTEIDTEEGDLVE